MKNGIEEKLEGILHNKQSGSSELLLQINSYLSGIFRHPQKLQNAIGLLKSHFVTFRNIQKYLEMLEITIMRNTLSENYFQKYKNSNSGSIEKIFDNSLPYLGRCCSILTISNSRTVFEIIKRLKSKRRLKNIIVTESRPKNEGRLLAKNLLREGIKVELILEAMTPHYIQKSDSVLIGADTVLSNGNVVNKAGSLQLALLSRYFGKPFYVAADRTKFGRNKLLKQRIESPHEIWKNHPALLKIRNTYFEEIDRRLITKIITD